MHIGANKQRRLRANWIYQTIQVSFTGKARGVAILSVKTLNFAFNQ